jgi:exodeoxyribonuclease VII small subunit
MEFEEKLKVLEENIKKLESEESLSNMIKIFEESMSLARQGFEELNSAKTKITEIIERNSKIIEKDFN